jgi:hypothetical protein
MSYKYLSNNEVTFKIIIGHMITTKKTQILDGFFLDGFKNRLKLNFYRRFFENRP